MCDHQQFSLQNLHSQSISLRNYATAWLMLNYREAKDLNDLRPEKVFLRDLNFKSLYCFFRFVIFGERII